MTNVDLARAYLEKCRKRLKALAVLHAEQGWSDVIREAQEIVELALKGILRAIGVEPPRIHDVGGLLVEHRDKLPDDISAEAPRLAAISKRLRKERELAFYGDIDYIPTEEYDEADSRVALDDATWVVETAARLLGG